MHNIENTKQLLSLACRLGGVVGAVWADEKLGFDDVITLWDMIKSSELRRLPEIDLALVPKELADLTVAEAEELREFAKATLNLPQEELELKIEKALDLGVKLYSTFKAALDLAAQLRKVGV
jgi:hypothetical protein